ncbi:MAG: RidA family protein [Flavobacteriales bacterium]
MKQVVYTPKAPAPIGPYSQANRAGDFLYVSGQIAIDPSTQEFIPSTAQDEAKMALDNITAILQAANCSWNQVCKTTIFLMDMADFPAVNEVYAKYFEENFPARETVQVAGLPKNARVEISVVVYLGK